MIRRNCKADEGTGYLAMVRPLPPPGPWLNNPFPRQPYSFVWSSVHGEKGEKGTLNGAETVLLPLDFIIPT